MFKDLEIVPNITQKQCHSSTQELDPWPVLAQHCRYDPPCPHQLPPGVCPKKDSYTSKQRSNNSPPVTHQHLSSSNPFPALVLFVRIKHFTVGQKSKLLVLIDRIRRLPQAKSLSFQMSWELKMVTFVLQGFGSSLLTCIRFPVLLVHKLALNFSVIHQGLLLHVQGGGGLHVVFRLNIHCWTLFLITQAFNELVTQYGISHTSYVHILSPKPARREGPC